MTPKYRFYNGERNNPYVLEQNIVRYLYWGMEAVESYMLQLHPDMPDSWLACYRKKMESGQVPEWISCRNEPEEEKAFVYYVYAKAYDFAIGAMPMPKNRYCEYYTEGRIETMTDDEVYAVVKEYIRSKGIDPETKLSGMSFRWYVDFCRVVSAYINDKCSVREIMKVSDSLNDLLTERLEEFSPAFPLRKADRIRGCVRALEWFEETKGRLSYEEKEAWAFCSMYASCIRVHKEETNEDVPPTADFADPELIGQLYGEFKNDRPELFARHVPDSEGEFGHSPDNPIQGICIKDSTNYLGRLYPSRTGIIFSWERKGSRVNALGNLIDEWHARKWDPERQVFVDEILYVDPYCEFTSTKAPEGWQLSEVRSLPGGVPYRRVIMPMFSEEPSSAPARAFVKMFDEEGWPVSAGWGYGPETAVKLDPALIGKNPQCGKTAEEVKKSFVIHRIRAELSISVHHIWKRSVARLEVKHIHTSTEWVDGVPYEKGDYLVSFYFKDEIDALEADWDAHDGYKKDEAGRKSLDRRDACCRIMSREPFWFATIES